MNILVLNYEFPPLGGGAAPVSRDISYQYSKLGHKVVVLTMGYKDLAAYEIVEDIEIYRLKCWRSKKSSCMPWEQYTYLLAVKKFMRQHMKTHQYDVCHTHFVIPTGAVAKWVKRRYNIPYIITAHGSDVEGHNQKIIMKVMHRILRSSWRRIVDDAKCVVAPSNYLKELMEKNYPGGKYKYIPNGINWDKFHDLREKDNKQKTILIMGRLQSFKNVQTIIQALSKVDLAEWHVDILGDGPYRSELEKQAGELRLSDKITFHGWIDNGTREQLQIIEQASIYISASRIDNCPMSVIETIAAGCHPLLSDIPAHRQLVTGDEYFFETNNVDQLSLLIADKIEKMENGKAILPDVSMYDWNNVIPRYMELMELQKTIL